MAVSIMAEGRIFPITASMCMDKHAMNNPNSTTLIAAAIAIVLAGFFVPGPILVLTALIGAVPYLIFEAVRWYIRRH